VADAAAASTYPVPIPEPQYEPHFTIVEFQIVTFSIVEIPGLAEHSPVPIPEPKTEALSRTRELEINKSPMDEADGLEPSPEFGGPPVGFSMTAADPNPLPIPEPERERALTIVAFEIVRFAILDEPAC
jgi:hypothetical protein